MTENKKGLVWYISPIRMRTALALVPHYIAFDESETRREEGIKVIEHSSYKKAVEALRKIASEDFRGNRPQSSVDAYNTLKELGEI